MEPLYEYKMVGGLFIFTIYPNRISIVDKRNGLGGLIAPKTTDIFIKQITGINLKGFVRKITLTLNDGTMRELPYPIGPEAEKARDILAGLI